MSEDNIKRKTSQSKLDSLKEQIKDMTIDEITSFYAKKVWKEIQEAFGIDEDFSNSNKEEAGKP
jgi:hypothetical protein